MKVMFRILILYLFKEEIWENELTGYLNDYYFAGFFLRRGFDGDFSKNKFETAGLIKNQRIQEYNIFIYNTNSLVTLMKQWTDILFVSFFGIYSKYLICNKI